MGGLHDDLAHMAAARKAIESSSRLFEGVHRVNDRAPWLHTHAMKDRFVHIPRTCADAAQRESLVHEYQRIHVPGRQYPDQADCASETSGCDRSCEGSGSTDLHSAVHTFAPGDSFYFLLPFGMQLIVDT